MATVDIGRLVGGRYRIDRELDCGAGTRSILATDLRNGRPCVLRLLSVASATPAAAHRFETQAAILAKLDHRGLPRFIDGFSEGEGDAAERAVVTSYHPGESLERLIAKGRPLTESQALLLLRRIVPVLAYLHAFDPPLVHRTISATGIILGPDGRPCLTDLDFSGAELAAPSPEQSPPGPDELALAAPEVYMGGALPASDIYALGLAVCRGMTGKDPVLLLREGARMQLRGALGVSEAFSGVIARMLEPSLERRYPDVRALDADLARLAGVRVVPTMQQPLARPAEDHQQQPSDRPLLRTGAIVALLVLLALVAVAVWLRDRPVPEQSLLISPASNEPAPAPAPATGTATEVVPANPDQAPAPGVEPGAAGGASPASEPAVSAIVDAPPVLAEQPVSSPGAPAATPATAVPTASAPASVEVRLHLDGKPFTGADAPAPRFWFRNEETKAVEQLKVTRVGDGFAVGQLAPGRYGMSVRIDLNPANPSRFPGDLDAWSQFTVGAGSPSSIEVPLRRIIRLLQPVDTNAVVPGWDVPCGSRNVHPGQMVFAWEPLPAGATYRARIDRLACGRGYAAVGTAFSRSTPDAWVKVDLPPSADGECYSFSLTASEGVVPVGIMTTHGTTGLSWDYRFTVAGGR